MTETEPNAETIAAMEESESLKALDTLEALADDLGKTKGELTKSRQVKGFGKET